jgi:membrane-associated protein
VFHQLTDHLAQWCGAWGPWFYVFLFALIFAETGLVVVPFLPGDSVLVAVGALAAGHPPSLDLAAAGVVLCAAAIAGDSTNYWIGHAIGPRIFSSETSRFLNRKHLHRAREFYARHGGKTVIVCRFLAVIRTFAPFVAGAGSMEYPRFIAYSVLGTLVWVWSFLLVGFKLGQEFGDKVDYVIYGIIAFAVVPPTVARLRERAVRRRAAGAPSSDRG